MTAKPLHPTDKPDAPPHLSARAAELWRAVVPRRAASLARQALVRAALESLDRADEAARTISADGLVQGSGRVPHAHPLLKVERESRQLFARLWSQMNLHIDAIG